MKKIKIGIIGGAGYTGGELIRLLIHHPQAELVFVHSKSQAGLPIAQVHQDLAGDTALRFSEDAGQPVDCLFLCLGHGEARKFLEGQAVQAGTRLIDLSQDFRLAPQADFQDRHFVYGLPELNRDAIRQADNIANPGCFATAIQLGLLPLAKAGLLEDIYTTGITGSTGAGQGLSPTSHFSWRAGNIQAYKTLQHQHLGEINQSLQQLQPGKKPDLSFIPWRGDFTRGIFVSSTLRVKGTLAELTEIFQQYYRDQAFTRVWSGPLHLKQVVNTNKCLIQLEQVGEKLVVHTVIDNLLKGASGQAVQNMNLMFALPEASGLQLKAAAF